MNKQAAGVATSPSFRQSNDRLNRRAFFQLSTGAVLAGAAFAGCSSGGGGGGSTTSKLLTILRSQPTSATESGFAITPLATVNGSAQGTLWGVTDSSGVPLAVTQALANKGDASKSARVLFDANGFPSLIRVEATGAMMKLEPGTNSVTLRFFKPDGTHVGSTKITLASDGTLVSTPIVKSTATGAFSSNITGKINGQLAFSISNTGRAISLDWLKDKANKPAPTRGIGDWVNGVVNNVLSGQASTTQVVRDIYRGLGRDLIQGGGIVALIGAVTGVNAVLFAGGVALVAGLLLSTLFSDTVSSIAQRLNSGSNVSNDLGESTSAPSQTYSTVGSFTSPASVNDAVTVNGVFVSQSGSVPLTGTIDANNNLQLAGTGLTFGGQVAGTQVNNGNYTSPSGTGTWTGAQTSLGTCQQNQDSGGQGIFSKIYNLGKTSGTFPFTYEAYSIPDTFEISYEGRKIFTSGKISGGQTVNVSYSGSDTFIVVTVIGDESGTAWDYTTGCP